MAAVQAEVAIWGEASPRGFFDRFPGLFGQHWVSHFGTYNEHLVRDFAAAELGFAVLLAAAAVWFERRLVLTAGTAFLVFTLSHLTFHLTETGALSTSGNALSLGSFVVEMALVAAVMASAPPTRPAPPERRSHGTTEASPIARA